MGHPDSAIYPETGKMIAQSLLGRNLRDCLPAVKGFYNLKQEHLMERKQRELVAAKYIKNMMDVFLLQLDNLGKRQHGFIRHMILSSLIYFT